MAEFRVNGKRIIEAHLHNEMIRAIAGSMVAYDGQIQFKKAPMGGGEGFAGAIKRRVGGESLELMECTGTGVIYLAIDAAEVEVVELTGDQLKVEASSLLAYEPKLQTNVTFAGLGGMAAGQGIATTTVTGYGKIALLSQGGPLIALEVSPQYPLVVDPQAYVAARGQMNQSFVTDVSWRSAVGGGSGEEFSLRFDGNGVVYIQPAER